MEKKIYFNEKKKKKNFVADPEMGRARGASRRQADAGTGAGARRWGARQQAARARGRQARGALWRGRGRQARARQASGSRRGRARSTRGWAGWAAGARPESLARGLALGSVLGALGPFSIRFDSFFPESPNEHCSL